MNMQIYNMQAYGNLIRAKLNEWLRVFHYVCILKIIFCADYFQLLNTAPYQHDVEAKID